MIRFCRTTPVHVLVPVTLDGRVMELPGGEVLARRKAQWKAPKPRFERGYGRFFSHHVTQADRGCDFDFLEAGPPTPDPEIH